MRDKERQTALERLRWAISFGQEDFDKLRPGDKDNAKHTLHEFAFDTFSPLGRGALAKEVGRLCSKEKRVSFEEVTEQELKTIHSWFRGWTEALAKEVTSLRVSYDTAPLQVLFLEPDTRRYETHSFHMGSWEDSVKSAFFFYVQALYAGQVRVCPVEDCGRIFLTLRKPHPGKVYGCTHQHTQKLALQRFHDKQAKRELEERRRKKRG